MTDTPPHIGTLSEGHLHAGLKEWYRQPGDAAESRVGGYVIDLVRDTLLIEIQTRGFSSVKTKLRKLLEEGHRIRIVHPIAIDRWIVKVDHDGTILSRRKSPKHGTPADIFSELVSFPDLATNSNLEIELLMTIEDEYRVHVPGKAWRRHGWTVMERRLIEVVESTLLSDTSDLTSMVPAGLPDRFTTADLVELGGGTRRNAQQMAYCLRSCGVFEVTGKRGNAIEYRMA